MAKIDDLKAAVDRNTAVTAAAVAALHATSNDAALEAATAQINKNSDDLAAATPAPPTT